MEYVLSVKGLKKSYRECQILRGVNLNVPEGCIYGLIGRNGAGKTTLFRVLTGLQRADEGTVGFNFDEKARKKRSQSCNMGAIIESPALYREMTAVDNMIEQSRLLGMKSYDPQPLLKLVGLDNTGKKKVKHFSLGMRQRLGIAISLVGNPKLLILDEPINGLDPDGIIEIRELINKLNKECGITIIISSHILAELAKVATVFGFLQDGELKKELTREEL